MGSPSPSTGPTGTHDTPSGIALFERRPWSNIVVKGGYLTVSFATMGTILGAWR